MDRVCLLTGGGVAQWLRTSLGVRLLPANPKAESPRCICLGKRCDLLSVAFFIFKMGRMVIKMYNSE